MPSPFPGMDPYLEDPTLWSDFQLGLLSAMRASLNASLPDDYVARLDRHVWCLSDADGLDENACEPDVKVESSIASPSNPPPFITFLPLIPCQGDYLLRVMDQQWRRVVSVIELLGHSRKRQGVARGRYLFKRDEYLGARINLIEIDLLRTGDRFPQGEPTPPLSDYSILIGEASAYPTIGLWPLSVRDHLPRIPIPLTDDEKPVILDLKSCTDRAYNEGPYSRLTRLYKKKLDPPLRDPDATWARELLTSRLQPNPPA